MPAARGADICRRVRVRGRAGTENRRPAPSQTWRGRHDDVERRVYVAAGHARRDDVHEPVRRLPRGRHVRRSCVP